MSTSFILDSTSTTTGTMDSGNNEDGGLFQQKFGLDDDDNLLNSPRNTMNTIRNSSFGSADSFDKFLHNDGDGNNMNSSFNMSFNELGGNKAAGDLSLEDSGNTDQILEAALNKSTSNDSFNMDEGRNSASNMNNSSGIVGAEGSDVLKDLPPTTGFQSEAQSNPFSTSMGTSSNAGSMDISDTNNNSNGGMRNAGFAASALDAKPLNISMTSIASTLRNKKAAQHGKAGRLQPSKASLSSSSLRSTMSDGMLARALKARYNSQPGYNMNEKTAASVLAAGGGSRNNLMGSHARSRATLLNKLQNAGAITASRANNLNQLNNPSSRVDMMDDGGGGGDGGGQRNAVWGAPPAKRSPSSASIFSNMMSSSAKHSMLSGRKGGGGSSRLLSAKSTSSLLSKAGAAASGRKVSMSGSITDLLRMSKQQTKTQSLLRQSSAQSLMKQTSSNALKDVSRRVDVSSLLPMSHRKSNEDLMGSASGTGASGGSSGGVGGSSGSMETSSLLHQSCRLYPTNGPIVESALQFDPEAIRRVVPVVSTNESAALTKPRGMAGMALPNKMQRKPQEIYSYPVNIAIKHGGSSEVLQILVNAGKDVLALQDGNDASSSLAIALTTKKCDLNLVKLLTTANPQCVKVADRRANYPLHIAASFGCSLDIVRHIQRIFPKALQMRNFHSQTPLDIAQRSTVCPEEVMNFLQSAAYTSLEHSAYHLDHHRDATPTSGGCGSGGGNRGTMNNGRIAAGGMEDNFDDIMETNL